MRNGYRRRDNGAVLEADDTLANTGLRMAELLGDATERRSRRELRLIAAVCLAFLSLVAFASLPAAHWEGDFLSFYAGAKLAGSPYLYSASHVHAIQAPYEQHPAEIRAFIRLPFYALLLWPLGRLPYRAALVAWQLLNLAALALFIFLWSPRSLSFPLCCFCFPVWLSLMYGQDMPLILGVVAVSVFLLTRGRGFLAGLVIALCAVKFHLFLLLPLIVVSKRLWRFGLGAAAGGVGLLAISFTVAGPNWPAQYYALVKTNETYQASQSTMPNLIGLFHGLPHATLWIALLSVAIAIGTYYALRRADLKTAFALALCGGVLVGLHAYVYDLGFLLPMLILSEHRGATRAMIVAGILALATLAICAPSIAFVGQLSILGVFAAALYETGWARSPSTADTARTNSPIRIVPGIECNTNGHDSMTAAGRLPGCK
jgi:hypothetical protein